MGTTVTAATAVLAMLALALPHLAPSLRAREAEAIAREARAQGIDAALVVAIVTMESGGNPRACANDRYGGSARGLMQVRRPASRCGRARRDALFDVEANVARGVAIVASLARFEREHHASAHDPLDHYAGVRRPGREPSAYARRVRALARSLAERTGTWR